MKHQAADTLSKIANAVVEDTKLQGKIADIVVVQTKHNNESTSLVQNWKHYKNTAVKNPREYNQEIPTLSALTIAQCKGILIEKSHQLDGTPSSAFKFDKNGVLVWKKRIEQSVQKLWLPYLELKCSTRHTSSYLLEILMNKGCTTRFDEIMTGQLCSETCTISLREAMNAVAYAPSLNLHDSRNYFHQLGDWKLLPLKHLDHRQLPRKINQFMFIYHNGCNNRNRAIRTAKITSRRSRIFSFMTRWYHVLSRTSPFPRTVSNSWENSKPLFICI